jgi:hypothetical protein
LRDLRTFSRFLVPRGPDAPGLIKPMRFHPFLGFFFFFFPIFAQKSLFHMISTQIGALAFLADFKFFSGNHYFRENCGIAKTPIIPKEYQRFWRVDCPENAKSTEFTKIPDIL